MTHLYYYRWLESVDDRPGLNRHMLEVLRQKHTEDPDTYTTCSIQLDGMAIRQLVAYDAHHSRMAGFVNLGTDENNNDVAKEALVFMVVGTRGRWKLPIAYYLTRGLTADQQKELLTTAIEELQSIGYRVIAAVMDGLTTNVTMCSLLGCQLDVSKPLQTWFSISGQKIYVILDACHMLKLVRNTLEAYRTINSPSGTVSWMHLSDLHKVQQELGLRLANRLSSRHLQFQNLKMKVSLAAQTFSQSVATALRMLHDDPDRSSQFADVLPTVEFIEIINRLFDIFNSRNPRSYGFKRPIGTRNIDDVFTELRTIKRYLMTLKTDDGKFLYQSKRYYSFHYLLFDALLINAALLLYFDFCCCNQTLCYLYSHTCVTGFVINIESMMNIVTELLGTHQYVLTYKFSQDHLELFFNFVRRAGLKSKSNIIFVLQLIISAYHCI